MLAESTTVGPYTVKRCLGQGLTGTVYLAWDNPHRRPVALKILEARLAKDPGVVKMFEAEAHAGQLVQHANIVQMLSVGKVQGLPYIAFEYVTGAALDKRIEKDPLAEGECIWVLRQIGQALRHLFQKGIVHQDIKPANILIAQDGTCKLADLGFARVAGGPINWDGFAAGSAFYMSPEQCRPQKGLPIDHRADLYALGATVYHAATGRPPFEAKQEEEVRRMHLTQAAPPARERNPKLRADFSELLARLLEKDIKTRYQSPEALLLDLRTLTTPPTQPRLED